MAHEPEGVEVALTPLALERAGTASNPVVVARGEIDVATSPLLRSEFATVLALECEDVAIRSSIVRVGPTTTGFADGWDLEQFAEIIPQWNRFGIQRHFNTMQPDDVARAVVSIVTAPPHMWVPVVEVQPRPPVA